MEDFVTRMYSILYSEHFRMLEAQGWTSTAIHEKAIYDQRIKLVNSALRYGQTFQVTKKETQAPSEMTEFTPFSINEFEYEVWDTSRQRQDMFLARNERKHRV